MKNVLVTGGAGYIGSHIVKKLLDEGYNVIVFDNISTGFMNNIDKRSKLVQGDLLDKSDLELLFRHYEIDTVFHEAALKSIEDSMKDPRSYYETNVIGTLNLLGAMVEHNVENVIFSSTATSYGNREDIGVLHEELELQPFNVYGHTKVIMEGILTWYSKIYNIKYIIFRYFNVAGVGFPEFKFNEGEKNLIPIVIRNYLENKVIKVFGDDYNTKDGTCIRDYIHIEDVARAHVLAGEKIDNLFNKVYNIGTGTGNSVFEVITEFEKIIGQPVQKEIVERREGDTAVLVCSTEKAERELAFRAEYTLCDMLSSTYENIKRNRDV